MLFVGGQWLAECQCVPVPVNMIGLTVLDTFNVWVTDAKVKPGANLIYRKDFVVKRSGFT